MDKPDWNQTPSDYVYVYTVGVCVHFALVDDCSEKRALPKDCAIFQKALHKPLMARAVHRQYVFASCHMMILFLMSSVGLQFFYTILVSHLFTITAVKRP